MTEAVIELPPVVQLSPKVSNQIAAGEVVARPASVVKELLENAIDAGATTVVVEITSGGVGSIRVVDDGVGMNRADAVLSLQRHATSKIRAVEDLASINTFGFRGEALPSIASVSHLTMRTRSRNLDEGHELRVEGGAEPVVRPCGTAPGTIIEVQDLFYNVPARRKFLRAVGTESAHISEAVREAALAHHELQFELIRDGRQAQRWLRCSTQEERVRQVFGDVALVTATGERGPVRVTAYLSLPERARSGAGGLRCFVGRRPVQDRALARAVASAYGESLERGRYPVGAVFLEVPPDLVDINVHPQKAEVRFAHARAITDAVYSVVSGSLGSVLQTSSAGHRADATGSQASASAAFSPARWTRDKQSVSSDWSWQRSAKPDAIVTASARQELPNVEHRSSSASPSCPEETTSQPSALAHAPQFVALLRGQILLCTDRLGLCLLNLRHCRSLVLRSRVEQALSRGDLGSQRLLFPLNDEVGDSHCQAAEDAEANLQHLGFELRRVGPQSLAMAAVPRLFAEVSHKALFSALLEAISAGPWRAETSQALLDDLISQAASETKGLFDNPADLLAALSHIDGGVEAAAVKRLGWSELGVSA